MLLITIETDLTSGALISFWTIRTCLDQYVHRASTFLHLIKLEWPDWVISSLITDEFEKQIYWPVRSTFFRENCYEYEESVHENSIAVKIGDQTSNLFDTDSQKRSNIFDKDRGARDDLWSIWDGRFSSLRKMLQSVLEA